MKKPKKEEKPLSGAQEAYEWLQILIVALVTIILVFTFVGRITPVVGESMLPTLHEGDVMLIRDIGYTDPQPGASTFSRTGPTAPAAFSHKRRWALSWSLERHLRSAA